MRARSVLLVVLLLWAGAAAAQPDPRRRLTALDVVSALPASLGGLARQGEVTDFESRPGGAGLGASASYRVVPTARSAPVRAPDGRPAMGSARMLLIYQDGHRAESFTCVGVIGLRFLKLRMTLPVEGKGLTMEEASLAAIPMREGVVTAFGAAALAAVAERLR
jgi:hypothetical protein